MPDYSLRSIESEVMDDLEYSGELMDRTLFELEVINKWLGGNTVTLDGIERMVQNLDPKEVICIADLGCGRGDMLRLIQLWAKKENRKVRLMGIDANLYIINAAKVNLKQFPDVELVTMNIYSAEFQKMKFDIVIGTLFYHHFSDGQLSTFFRQLKDQTRLGFIINDIHRHPVAYYSIRLLTKYFSRSAMVKYDAPLSVLKAFKGNELKKILKHAGVGNFTIKWKWAFRWQVLAFNPGN